MTEDSRIKRPVALVILSLLVAACPGNPGTNTPTTPTPPIVSTVVVEGPGELAPGESAQYSATLSLSTFVTKVPKSVRWIASPPSFLQVDASGFATGGPFSGGAAVTADVTLADGSVRRASKSVIVLPSGTFQLLGAVTDAALHPLPVPGARVQTTPGSLEVFTDSAGFYRLFGVPPNVEVRITADGYEPFVQTLELGTHTRQDFRLTKSGGLQSPQ